MSDSSSGPFVLKYCYPTCERTAAKLCIFPLAETCNQVTEKLKLDPTETQDRSDGIENRHGATLDPSYTLWVLSSEDQVESVELGDHLDWLLERIAPRKMALRELQNLEGMRMAIWCVYWSEYGHGGPTLSPEQMGRIADLNLEWTIDVGFLETTL